MWLKLEIVQREREREREFDESYKRQAGYHLL